MDFLVLKLISKYIFLAVNNNTPIEPITNDELRRDQYYIGTYKVEMTFRGRVPILYPSSSGNQTENLKIFLSLFGCFFV